MQYQHRGLVTTAIVSVTKKRINSREMIFESSEMLLNRKYLFLEFKKARNLFLRFSVWNVFFFSFHVLIRKRIIFFRYVQAVCGEGISELY